MSYPIVNFLPAGTPVYVVTRLDTLAADEYSLEGEVIQADGIGLYLKTYKPLVLRNIDTDEEASYEAFLPWANIVEVSK